MNLAFLLVASMYHETIHGSLMRVENVIWGARTQIEACQKLHILNTARVSKTEWVAPSQK